MMEKLYFKDIQHIATRSAIRHWQKVGLLPDDREINGLLGYRVFDATLLPRIKEIAHLRKVGVSCYGIGLYYQELERRAIEMQTEKAVITRMTEDVLGDRLAPPIKTV